VCLLLAIRRPALVRTLVLAEPPVVTLLVSNAPKPREIGVLLATRPRTALAVLKFAATGIAPAAKAARRGDLRAATETFGRAVLGREFFQRLSPDRLEQVHANSTLAEFLGSGFPPLSEDEVRGVCAPTLLVGGARSPALFRRLLDRLEELLPRCERVEIAGASHIVHEDDPAAFDAAVLAFLARHRHEKGQEPGAKSSSAP
jgi:pimeloyl-ACP methyl ester carboxylesterase